MDPTQAAPTRSAMSRLQGTDGKRRERDREVTHYARKVSTHNGTFKTATLEGCIKHNHSSNAAFIWRGHK